VLRLRGTVRKTYRGGIANRRPGKKPIPSRSKNKTCRDKVRKKQGPNSTRESGLQKEKGADGSMDVKEALRLGGNKKKRARTGGGVVQERPGILNECDRF